MTPKELVKSFYDSDLANSSDAIDRCFHKDCILNWHSSKGFNALNFNGLKSVFEEISKAYQTVRFDISHLLQDDNSVIIRYTSYATTFENPDEEIALAHFISIWEVKDGKIIKGHQLSQLADTSISSLKSFS